MSVFYTCDIPIIITSIIENKEIMLLFYYVILNLSVQVLKYVEVRVYWPKIDPNLESMSFCISAPIL
jgi:IS4 transposase